MTKDAVFFILGFYAFLRPLHVRSDLGVHRGGALHLHLWVVLYIYIYTPHLALYWWIFFALEASGRIIFALKVSYFIADTGT